MKINKSCLFILFALIISLGIGSCCKKPKTQSIICSLPNKMAAPDKTSCICDSNSVLENGVCKFVFPGIKGLIDKGWTGIFKTVSKNCGDWRDSIFLPIVVSRDFTKDCTSLIFGVGHSAKSPYTWCDVHYHKDFGTYDSVASECEMDFPYLQKFGLYMKVNKNRDTAWTMICKTEWFPVYKRLDTCRNIMTRIY
jgi:hypothetical protein